MLDVNKKILLLFLSFILIATSTIKAQNAQVIKPSFWFGVTTAANMNFLNGTTQKLNSNLTVPTSFHKGSSVRPYSSFFINYHPGFKWGAEIKVGYDSRGGSFNDVMAPCDCLATLTTRISYITLEPNFHFAPSLSSFYFFGGPGASFNIENSFLYTEVKKADVRSKLSDINKALFSGQIGVGYNIDLPSPTSIKIKVSPFVSFHPYIGQNSRSIQSWSTTTVRAGVALKIGKAPKAEFKEINKSAVPEITFSVRAPKALLLKRKVSETVPLRNSVFFEEGSAEIPNRYGMLTQEQALNFKEEQLHNLQSENLIGRSSRQLNVYYNILNILGDRMRTHPETTIILTGSSAKGTVEGREEAESVKQYLVNTFGIHKSRISTDGRIKPTIPSEQPGATKDFDLIHAEDNRVDIESTSAKLLMQVGGGIMKSVQIIDNQENPLDGHVIFNIGGAEDVLASWSIEMIDDKGAIQHYGPFTKNQESISAKSILKDHEEGSYKVVMHGKTNSGLPIRKESSVYLLPQKEVIEKGYRHSILFDFDQSKTVDVYEKFLMDIVTPLIQENGTVIIHGHTDILGEDLYNQTLSKHRALEVQNILKWALLNAGKSAVNFETMGFGEDSAKAPFQNLLPEERFYNRTVIIDILEAK